MIKNFIIIENDIVNQNIGGVGLTAEKVKELYPNGKIVELKGTQGVAVGLPVALFEDDFSSLKTEKELASEGLDPEGKPIPTAAEVAAKAESERLEQERLAREAELAAAKVELGDGDWSDKQITQKAAEIKDRELKLRIYSVADQKHREVLTSIYGSQMQYQRDSNRYERAKKGKFTEGENESLIQDYEQKGRALDPAIDNIEEIRSYIADIVDNDMERAKKALENWRNYLLEGDVGDFLASI